MITRIEAYRYRCFEKLDLTLDRFQVFVGPNGAGKTTLLDIPILLGEMLTLRSVEKAFLNKTDTHPRPRTDYGGDLIFKHDGNQFILAIEAALPKEITADLLEKQVARTKSAKTVDRLRKSPSKWLTRIRYEIQIELFNEALQIAQEYVLLLPEDESWKKHAPAGLVGEWLESARAPVVPVVQRGRDGKIFFTPEAEARGPRNDYSFPTTEPAFANVFADRTRYGASLWLRSLLSESACAYQPSLIELRNAQPRQQNPQLVRDGSTLAWLAYLISPEYQPENEEPETKTRRLRRFDRWQRLAGLALANLDRIQPFVRPDDLHAYLRLHYRNGAIVPSSGLSDGTLSILAITILPFLPQTPALIVHEEPENGVHPRGLEVMLDALRTVHQSQVLVSSHSPLVLAQCRPDEVICLSTTAGGAATAIRGEDHPSLKEWRESVDLGLLLASGVLG